MLKLALAGLTAVTATFFPASVLAQSKELKFANFITTSSITYTGALRQWIDDVNAALAGKYHVRGYFGGTLFYGYQWWMGRSLAGDKEIKWVAAFGWGGQRIFIVPELDLVMMTTAAQYGQPKEGLAAIDILTNIVIPSVRDAH